MPSHPPHVLAYLWRLSALQVSLKFLRLHQAVLKAGFNPSQPRAPAGAYDGTMPIGGRWVAAGTSVDRIRVAISVFDNPGLYYVDLEKEQLKGGHPVTKHVGKGNNYLISYQLVWHAAHPGKLHPAEGSFNSIGEANNLVSQTLRSDPLAVQDVIQGREKRKK